MRTTQLIVALAFVLISAGCIVAPLPVSAPVDALIVDADDDRPIAGAAVVHFVCDVHDFHCHHGRLVRTESSADGRVRIPRRWRWGLWIAAPGGLPVPNHFVAIWAPGYSPFVFSQYEDPLEHAIERIGVSRPDVAAELKALPDATLSSDPTLNPPAQLIGGRIRLHKSESPSAR
jgi:hypothetical protein